MIATVKVLKRKDASSVIVAIVVGLIINQLFSFATLHLTSVITGLNDGQGFGGPGGPGWRGEYLYPVVSAVLQLLLLEIGINLYVFCHSMMTKKDK